MLFDVSHFSDMCLHPRDRRVVVCENVMWPSKFRAALRLALYELEVIVACGG